MGTISRFYTVYIGIIGLYWGNIGIVEKKMETTIVYKGIYVNLKSFVEKAYLPHARTPHTLDLLDLSRNKGKYYIGVI